MRTLRKQGKPTGREAGQQNQVVQDYHDVSDQGEQIVEHLSIPGFLKRIPHRWHMEEINRFGDKVGRAAESMHLAYLTCIDRSLGTVRVFPVPLLQRVYTVMSAAMGWPTIIEMDALEDGKREERDALKKQERAEKALQDILEQTDSPEVMQSVRSIIQYLESEIDRRRKEIGAPQP